MNERDNTLIIRIQDELQFILNVTKGYTKNSFLQDEIIQHAIAMSLITIGECANHLSSNMTSKHTQVQWTEIIAVRNIAAHGYWQLNMEQVWQAVEDDIPNLKMFFDSL